jgi:hypothetical protein
MPKINFIPYSHEADILGNFPMPASKFVPEWYKEIPQYTNGDKKIKFRVNADMPNSSLKKCVPFLDAMTLGYMVVLDEDVYVENVNNEPFIRWRSSDAVLSWHTDDQFKDLKIPKKFYKSVIKWNNDWGIELPDGYSAYFTHPNNRVDLPFTTLSGFVDCDSYNNPVQFPFLVDFEFEGIIEAGTPIVQILLIKREGWDSNKEKFNKEKVYLNNKNFFKTFVSSYKKNYWHKKYYN